MKRALTLLLFAAAAQSRAAAPAPCEMLWRGRDMAAIEQAQAKLATARARPGAQDLALADALADLAAATAHSGGPGTKPQDAGPSALDLLAGARAIWSAAQPTPELAAALGERGRRHLEAGQCALALDVLETAVGVADKAAGTPATTALAGSIMRDLVRVAAAIGDDPTLNTLAPRLAAGLDADRSPFAKDSIDAYLAAAAYFYRTEDNAGAERLLTRLLERARSAPAQDAGLVRRLTYELASIYYAQLRYNQARTLLAPLAQAELPAPGEYARHKESVGRMAAQVRSGKLNDALALGQETLVRYQAQRAGAAAALAAAEALQEAATREGRRADAEAARARAAGLRRDGRMFGFMLAEMQGNVGEVRHALGQHGAALALYEDALQTYRLSDTGDFQELARIRAGMGLIHRAQGDTARALALQQEVRQALLPHLGAEHPDVLQAQAEIAALQGTGRGATPD